MEELRSTETLDREILEDARKKAYRILKTADDTLEAQNKSWEKKTRRALEAIRKTYAERLEKNREEILARLPLDKRRLRSETSEGFLSGAMDGFLRSLGREKLLSVLERELSLYFEVSGGELSSVKDAKVLARYSALTLPEAQALMEKAAAAHVPDTAFLKNWDFREDSGVHTFPSLVIDAPSLKISASVESAAAALMRDRRAELAGALLGEGVLND